MSYQVFSNLFLFLLLFRAPETLILKLPDNIFTQYLSAILNRYILISMEQNYGIYCDR